MRTLATWMLVCHVLFVFWIGAFVLGIILLVKNKPGYPYGGLTIGTSVVAFLGGLLIVGIIMDSILIHRLGKVINSPEG